jgi:hypothetical protein
MFRIRPGHIEGLAEQQAEGFTLRMVAHLREVFPDEVGEFDDASLSLIISKSCATAAEWRIEDESHAERFLELLVSFPQLRREPLPAWITEIVTYPGRSGEHKLSRLENRLIFGEDE